MRQLGDRGARAAVIVSAGFRERGPDGVALERALIEAARPSGLRIMGPNCIGFMVPARGINASFAHLTPRAGDLAFVSQSGAMVAAMVDWAADRGVGFSRVISLGNMVDVDIGDLLDDLALDGETRAVLLYVEAIANARKFMSAARAAARKKPVLVIKAGSVAQAARAARAHTGAGALAAGEVGASAGGIARGQTERGRDCHGVRHRRRRVRRRVPSRRHAAGSHRGGAVRRGSDAWRAVAFRRATGSRS